MKIWLVEFTQNGFGMDAVVVAGTRSEAIVILAMTPDETLDQATEIGEATGDLTPRVVTQDTL